MAATKIRKWQIENLQIGDADVAAAAAIAISKIAGLNDALDSKEPAFSKNTAFNKNFGTAAGTVSEGNHTHDFDDLTNIPTTLSGFGITDAYTKSESDAITGDLDNLETTDKSNLVAALNEINGVVSDAVKPPLPIDCSGNPDYPAANKGDSYKVSVAGKIGGANGVTVEIGDLLIASVDTPSGDHATVGSNWGIYQTNLDKATESVFGTGRIATTAEVTAGTNDQAWITPAKLAAKLSGYVQTLSTGGQGAISISGGNTVRLSSLDRGNIYDGDVSGLSGAAGFYTFYTGNGATGFPTTQGSGIYFSRSSIPSANGSFMIFSPTGNNNKLTYTTGNTDHEWLPFQTFASEEHVAANYVTLNTAQTITGEKTFGSVTSFNGSNYAQHFFRINSQIYWRQGVSTAGDYIIHRTPDGGSTVNVLNLSRATGKATFAATVSGAQAESGSDFVTLAQANGKFLPLSGGNMTGNINIDATGYPHVQIKGASAADLQLIHSGAGTDLKMLLIRTSNGVTNFSSFKDDGSGSNVSNILSLNHATGEIKTLGNTIWHAGNLTPVDAAKYVAKETLAGAKDGTNKTFTLSNAPIAGKEMIFRNGVLLYEGSGLDYTISGATITLTTNQPAPVADEVLLGTYIY